MDAGNPLAVMDCTVLAMHMIVVVVMMMVMAVIAVDVVMGMAGTVIVLMMMVVMVIIVMMIMRAMVVLMTMRVAFLAFLTLDDGIGPAAANHAHQITSKSLIFNSSPAVIWT